LNIRGFIDMCVAVLASLYRKTALRLETSGFGLSHVSGIECCLLTF